VRWSKVLSKASLRRLGDVSETGSARCADRPQLARGLRRRSDAVGLRRLVAVAATRTGRRPDGVGPGGRPLVGRVPFGVAAASAARCVPRGRRIARPPGPSARPDTGVQRTARGAAGACRLLSDRA
jgi:hypothetical protein